MYDLIDGFHLEGMNVTHCLLYLSMPEDSQDDIVISVSGSAAKNLVSEHLKKLIQSDPESMDRLRPFQEIQITEQKTEQTTIEKND